MFVDEYLKNPNLSLNSKKNILAAFYQAAKTAQDQYVYLDDTSTLICIAHDETVTNEKYNVNIDVYDNETPSELDYNIVQTKLQVCYFLSQKKSNMTFHFYQHRLLHEWICFHPHYAWQTLIDKAKIMTKHISWEQQRYVKDEIYKKQTCFVCNEIANQFCAICGVVYYCSAKCQQSNWQKHKISCSIIKTIKDVRR